MKQFNLKEYLKDPSRKVVTRNGEPVRIICTDANQVFSDRIGNFPVVALITGNNNREFTYSYREDGLYEEGQSYSLDLFFATVKFKGWVNVYMTSDGTHKRTGTDIYDTEEEARQNCTACGYYVETVPSEWEEYIYETV